MSIENAKQFVLDNLEAVSCLSFIPSMAFAKEVHPSQLDKRWISLSKEGEKLAKQVWVDFYTSTFQSIYPTVDTIPKQSMASDIFGENLFLRSLVFWVNREGFSNITFKTSSSYFGECKSNHVRIPQGSYPDFILEIYYIN